MSPLSYIFGCTTPAYNELLETRWHSFRDLRGVHAALEEMRANGVSPDLRTRALVDDVRREVGARTIWLEESETGSGEVWTILKEIERLVARRAPRQASSDDFRALQEQPRPHDTWKNPELTSDESAGVSIRGMARARTTTAAQTTRITALMIHDCYPTHSSLHLLLFLMIAIALLFDKLHYLHSTRILGIFASTGKQNIPRRWLFLLVEETKKRAWRDMIISSNLCRAESINAVRPPVRNDSPCRLTGLRWVLFRYCGGLWTRSQMEIFESTRRNDLSNKYTYLPRRSFKSPMISARLAVQNTTCLLIPI